MEPDSALVLLTIDPSFQYPYPYVLPSLAWTHVSPPASAWKYSQL